MSEANSHSLESFPGDLPEGEIEELLALGRVKGVLSSEDLVKALKDVELTPELINDLVEWVTRAGIRYEDIDAVDRRERTRRARRRGAHADSRCRGRSRAAATPAGREAEESAHAPRGSWLQ